MAVVAAVAAVLVCQMALVFVCGQPAGLASATRLRGSSASQSTPLSVAAAAVQSLAPVAALVAMAGLISSSRRQRCSRVPRAARGGGLDYNSLVADLEDLVKTKNCGPILARCSVAHTALNCLVAGCLTACLHSH